MISDEFYDKVDMELWQAYLRACETLGVKPRRRAGFCCACGIRHDKKTPGCKNCYSRHWELDKRLRERAVA